MTPEELSAFNDEFRALLEKHSAYIEPVPMFQKVKSPEEDGFTFGVRCQLYIQKIVTEEKDEPAKES